jgi:PAS domain S-box-containing protein
MGLGVVILGAFAGGTLTHGAIATILGWIALSLLVLGVMTVALLRILRSGASARRPETSLAAWGEFAVRYLSAVVVVVVAVEVRWRLADAFGPLPTFVTLYPAVLLVASIGGGGPGILATVLSALAADYWFIPPFGRFNVGASNDLLSLGIFTGACLFLSVLAERLRRARWGEATAAARAQQLEELARVNEELAQQSEELAQQNEELQTQSEELAQQNEELQTQSEEIQALNLELEQRETMLQKLLGSARQATGDRTVLEKICAVGLEVFAPVAAVVAVYETRNGRLMIRALAGTNPEVANMEPRAVLGSFGELVLRENRTASLADTSLRPDFTLLRIPGEEPFRAVLATPMGTDGPPFGVVGIYSHQAHEWTAVQFRLAEWLAAQSARILETLRLQMAVAEAAEQHRLALEAANLGAWDYHIDTGEISWDPRCRSVFGVASGSRINIAAATRCIHPADRAAVDVAIRDALAGVNGGVYDREFRVVWPDGSVHWLAGHGRAYFQGEGDERRPVRFIGVSMDITHRKEAEEELRLAKQAAEAANEAKSQFLANMSHEIRTPMTAVLGFTELMIQPDSSPEERHEYLEIVQRSGKGLLQLIDDILDLSKIEAGKVTVESVDCSPRHIVDEVLSLMCVQANEKLLQLEASCHAGVPLAIRTDPIRLRQILVNLVGNAIKFTSSGQVRIDVSLAGGTRPMLDFAVSDTGIGISPEHQAEIFRPFSQADASLTRRFGGTGLGLAISRRLAKMLGGEITVRSELGKGSTFTLSIDAGTATQLPPVAHDEESNLEPTPAISRLHGRVLLVEDTPANQHLIEAILSKAGLEVELAASGEEGCRKALRSAAEDRPFDLILLDMQMPGIDGYEAARRLRQQHWQRPIIALTAHAMAGDREKCMAAGCNDYLAKPITRHGLMETVARHLDGRSVTERASALDALPEHG